MTSTASRASALPTTRYPLSPTTGNQNATSGSASDLENNNPNITVRLSGLDMFIPTIPKVNESDIKAKFKTDAITPIVSPTTGNQNATSGSASDSKNNNPNITVRSSGLDMFIPTIPKVNESDIKAKFKTDTITSINGEPTFEKCSS